MRQRNLPSGVPFSSGMSVAEEAEAMFGNVGKFGVPSTEKCKGRNATGAKVSDWTGKMSRSHLNIIA